MRILFAAIFIITINECVFCFRLPMSQSTLRSDVWEHFKRMENSAICVHCKKELSYCKSTTNLRDHLSRMHSSKYLPSEKKEIIKSSKAKMDAFITKTICSEGHAKKITNLIVEMIVLDLRPAAMVEGAGFIRLINYIEPGYRVPSAMHVTGHLEKKYLQTKGTVIEMLKEPSHIALTTDIWTSVATQSYITVTAHFVSSNWELRTYLLQTMNFPESHTAENIGDKLKDILSNFGIGFEKIVAVVHDQGSNMQACFRNMKTEHGWETVKCAAHCLQLCVEDGLKINSIARLLGACRKLVSHFRHSTTATAALMDRQKQMNMPTKKLMQDCSTRWNSSYYMLERLVDTRWPISAVLSDEQLTKRAD